MASDEATPACYEYPHFTPFLIAFRQPETIAEVS